MEDNLANYIKTNYPKYTRESLTMQLLLAGHSLESINQAWQFVEAKQVAPKPNELAYLKQPIFWLTALAVTFLLPIAVYVFTRTVAVIPLLQPVIVLVVYIGLYKAGVAIYPQRPGFGKGLSIGVLLSIIFPILWGVLPILPRIFIRY